MLISILVEWFSFIVNVFCVSSLLFVSINFLTPPPPFFALLSLLRCCRCVAHKNCRSHKSGGSDTAYEPSPASSNRTSTNSSTSGSSSPSASPALFGAGGGGGSSSSSNTHPLKQRKWSTIAYNNKNFPDGKLGYEHQHSGSGTTANYASASAAFTGGHGSAAASSTGATSASSKLFSKGYSKFEHSGQEAMARASQIVQ